MAEDNEQVVQNQEQVSQTEQVSTTGEKPPEGDAAQTQATLTPDTIQEMIKDAVSKAVEEAKETGRRELQSQQDRNRAALEREGRKTKAETEVVKSIRERFKELDPDVADKLELEELRAREKTRATFDEEETLRQRAETQERAMRESLVNHLKSLGIDPEDKRVDWAKEVADPIEGWTRFNTSVATIVKENQQTMQKGFEQRLKDLEDKIEKANIEVNSVETTSGGVVSGSDAEFMQDFGSGKLPMTKANMERYEKITKTYE